MLAPLLAVLWPSASVMIDGAAAYQWSEVRQLAETYHVDIDSALEPFPEYPVEDNFKGQPFLWTCLHDLEGLAGERMRDFSLLCGEPLGERLVYHRISASGYRLRSAGPDRVDNNGKPMTDGQGDIVWK